MARGTWWRAFGFAGAIGLALVVAACTSVATPSGSASGAAGAGPAAAPGSSALAARASAGNGGQQEGIWVAGVGRVTLTPDLAVLRLGVETQEPTVSAAREKAATAMQAVIDAVKGQGVAARDIQTQHFSIQPVYHWEEAVSKETGGRYSRQVLDGYQVTNQVTVRVRDLARVAPVVDEAATAGGDAIRITSISMTVEDPSRAQAEARTKAMQEALAHAQTLAEAAGLALGKALFISESTGQVASPAPFLERAAFARAEAAPPTPIEAGEMEVMVTVTAVFAIR